VSSERESASGGHPDVEALDAIAGDGRVSGATARHVRDCPDCAEAVAALRRVRAELAKLASLTMPPDVAARISAALAAADPPAAGAPEGGSGADPEASAVPDEPVAGPRLPIPHAREAGSRGVADLRGRSGPPSAGGGSGPAGRRRAGPGRVPTRPPRVPVGARGLHPGSPPSRSSSRPPSRPRSQPAPGRPGAFRGGPGGLAAAASLLVIIVVGTALYTARHGGSSGSGATVAPVAADGTTSAGMAGPAAVPSASRIATAVSTVVAASHASLTPADAGSHGVALVAGKVRGAQRVALTLDAAEMAMPREPTPAAAAGAAMAGLLGPDLRTCYGDLAAQSGGSVLGVDVVNFDGEPAAAVVLSIPGTSTLLRVVIIDMRCGPATMTSSLRWATVAARG
jgi:hypothetical protein